MLRTKSPKCLHFTLGIVLARMQVLGHSRLRQTTFDACACCTQSGETKCDLESYTYKV